MNRKQELSREEKENSEKAMESDINCKTYVNATDYIAENPLLTEFCDESKQTLECLRQPKMKVFSNSPPEMTIGSQEGGIEEFGGSRGLQNITNRINEWQNANSIFMNMNSKPSRGQQPLKKKFDTPGDVKQGIGGGRPSSNQLSSAD